MGEVTDLEAFYRANSDIQQKIIDDLSGKAIAELKSSSRVPENVRKLHFEYTLSEMVMALLEIFSKKMPDSFKITRKIEGKDRHIYFNQKQDEIENFVPDEFNHASEGGIINDLTQIDTDNIDLSIKIVLDSESQQAYKENKAMVAFDRQLQTSYDTLKDLYPDSYQERYDRKTAENQAMALVQKIMENPELGVILTNGLKEFKQLTKENEGLNEAVQGASSGNNGGNGTPAAQPANING